MRDQLTPQQLQELLDDFYSECDEQLGAARGILDELATSEPGSRGFQERAETLFRHLHSIKGNSGIVGLDAAEEVAHSAEDFLRQITRGTRSLDEAGIEAIDLALHRLGEVLSAHRTKSALPDVHDVTSRIAELLGTSSGKARKSASVEKKASPDELNEEDVWEFVFTPSKTLEARGINVSTVRARLASLGKIVSSNPEIKGPDSIRFVFKVQAQQTPAIDVEAWLEDGIRVNKPATKTAEVIPSATKGPGDRRSSGLFVAPSHVVRVDLSRLDDLMRIAGELVIHRSRLDGKIAAASEAQAELKEISQGLGKSLKELREAITRVRLVPVSEIFARIPSILRELMRNSEKQVEVKIEGEETEIDKHLVERLKEPLLHLVRNAFSHGVETPAARKTLGKPPLARITLRAHSAGDRVVIEIEDDGAGVDVRKVVERARSGGIAIAENPDDAALLDVLCTPGFSTRDAADLVAGRGVGMAVVRETVRELGGQLTMAMRAGQGSLFTLQLPLTLSILDTLLVTTGTQLCAIPLNSVVELFQVNKLEIKKLSNVEVVPYRGALLPITRLNRIFNGASDERSEHPVLVVCTERGSNGLMVDRVVGQREVVLRPMNDPLVRVPGIYGATELGDGRPLLILDPRTITSGAVRPHSSSS